MTVKEMEKAFESKRADREYLEFGRIPEAERLHRRPDLCALLLLDSLDTRSLLDRDIISAAEHDEIWFDVDEKRVAEVITMAQILTLIRCGVRFTADDGFAKFA